MGQPVKSVWSSFALDSPLNSCTAPRDGEFIRRQILAVTVASRRWCVKSSSSLLPITLTVTSRVRDLD